MIVIKPLRAGKMKLCLRCSVRTNAHQCNVCGDHKTLGTLLRKKEPPRNTIPFNVQAYLVAPHAWELYFKDLLVHYHPSQKINLMQKHPEHWRMSPWPYAEHPPENSKRPHVRSLAAEPERCGNPA